ncbi:MAG: ribonuclease J [Rhizomicrobium sp.]
MNHPERDDELVFLPLGGSGEIGMNFNAYGYGPPDDRKWIVVDCGVLFGRETTTPGVDLIMPDIRFLAEQRENVLAIVATHAHEDHIGAIPHLWPLLRCPVYATPFTAVLIEGKLEEAGLSAKVHPRRVPLSGRIELGPFAIEFISITHSIPEPNALAIRTPLGLIVHTGDWKIDPEPQVGEATDIAALKALGDEGVLATVCDSTNALVAGESGSEARVREALTALIGTLKGRVAVTSFASNVARLDTIARAAKALWPPGRPRRPRHAQDHRRRARDRLSEGLPVDHRRGRGGATSAQSGPLSVHRQPGRAARRAGPHRRGQPSQCQPRQGRRRDLLQSRHSGQRHRDPRAAQQAVAARCRGPLRRRPFRPCLWPSLPRRTGRDVPLDPPANLHSRPWRAAPPGRARPPRAFAAGAAGHRAGERPAHPPRPRPRRRDRRSAVGPASTWTAGY